MVLNKGLCANLFVAHIDQIVGKAHGSPKWHQQFYKGVLKAGLQKIVLLDCLLWRRRFLEKTVLKICLHWRNLAFPRFRNAGWVYGITANAG
jgi:hypothetical protein